jgi:hypothetical protein
MIMTASTWSHSTTPFHHSCQIKSFSSITTLKKLFSIITLENLFKGGESKKLHPPT